MHSIAKESFVSCMSLSESLQDRCVSTGAVVLLRSLEKRAGAMCCKACVTLYVIRATVIGGGNGVISRYRSAMLSRIAAWATLQNRARQFTESTSCV